jgi:hypothetical protein
LFQSNSKPIPKKPVHIGTGATAGPDFIDGKSAAKADALLRRITDAAILKDFIAALTLALKLARINKQN